jgi:rubrerythrin
MELNTASSVISFARELEENSAQFYESLAGQNPANEQTFLGYASENRKFIKQFESAYYGVITDAIEGCYAFSIDPDKYKTDTQPVADISAAVGQAVALEDSLIRFYTDAAEQSKSLMADVPRAFTLIARKRSGRKQVLESIH